MIQCNVCKAMFTAEEMFCPECGAASQNVFGNDTDTNQGGVKEEIKTPETVKKPAPGAFKGEVNGTEVKIVKKPAPTAPPKFKNPEDSPYYGRSFGGEVPDNLKIPDSSDSYEKKPEPVVIPDEPAAETSSYVVKPQRSFGAIAIALSVLLTAVLLAIVTAGQSWFVLRNVVNSETVKSLTRAVIDDMDYLDFIASLADNKDGVSPVIVKGEPMGSGKDISDVIYANIDEYYIKSFGIAESKVRTLLEQKAFRDFFGDVIDGGVDYLMGGDDNAVVTSARIVEMLRENSAAIEEKTGYVLVETDYEDIQKVLDESGINELTWSTAVKNLHRDAETIRDGLIFYQDNLKMIIIVIAAALAVCVLLLVLLNRRRPSNALVYFGIPCILSGGAIASLAYFADAAFEKGAELFKLSSASVISNVFAGMENVFLLCGLVTLGAGLAAVVVKRIVS